MSNKIYIEVTETRMHQITIDLDEYGDEVKEAYEKGDADFFSDWVDEAENTEITYQWG